MLRSEESRRHIQGVGQDSSVPDPKCAAVKGHQTPLVKVGANPVSVLVDTVQPKEVAVFRDSQRGSSPLSQEMEQNSQS